jgi:hypothetical protein
MSLGTFVLTMLKEHSVTEHTGETVNNDVVDKPLYGRASSEVVRFIKGAGTDKRSHRPVKPRKSKQQKLARRNNRS